MINNKKCKIVGLVFITIFSFFSCNHEKETPLASVGNVALKESNIEFANLKNLPKNQQETQKKIIINNWINTEMLYQTAKKRKLNNTEEINQKIQQYKKLLVIQDYLDSHVYNNIEITESELLERYNKNKNRYKATKNITLVINYLTNNKKDAEEIKGVLFLGNSQDIESLNNDFVTTQQIDKTNIFNFKNKKIIGPIKTDAGYVVTKLSQKLKKGEQIPFSYVRNEIKEEFILEKKKNLYKKLLTKLRNKNKVKTYEKNH